MGCFGIIYIIILAALVLIMFLMQDQNPMAITEAQLGTTAGVPHIYYIPVQDLDQSTLRIPIQSLDLTVADLITSYKEISSCLHMFEDDVCLQIVQGSMSSLLAIDSLNLQQFGLDLNHACFRVMDKFHIKYGQMVRTAELKMVELSEPHQIVFQVLFNQIVYVISANMAQSVLKVKLILRQRKQFANFSVDMIRLQANNIILKDKKKLSIYAFLHDNCVLKAAIGKGAGCVIAVGPQKQVQVDSLKVGDTILTYSTSKKIVEEDELICLHKTVSRQKTILIFEDGSIVQSAQYKFLCSDNRFRSVANKGQRQSLQVGQKLQRIDNKLAVIQHIETVKASTVATNYRLSARKNQALIVNGLIVRDDSFVVSYQQGQIKASFSENQRVSKIKQIIEDEYGLNNYQTMQLLTNTNSQLNDESSLLDYNLPRELALNLKVISYLDANFIFPSTKVVLRDQKYKMIKDIVPGDVVAAYNPNNKEIYYETLSESIIQRPMYEYYRITLETNEELNLSAHSFLQLQNGATKSIKQIYQQQLGRQRVVSLFKVTSKPARITKIEKISDDYFGLRFCRLNSQSLFSFIIQGWMVIHNLTVPISLELQAKQQKISFGINSSTTVQHLKAKLLNVYKINKNDLQLYRKQCKLSRQQPIVAQRFKFGQILIATTKIPEQSYNKHIQLHYTQSSPVYIPYQIYKNKHLQQILQWFIPNYRTFYFCTFHGLNILPTDKLSVIEESEQFSSQKCVLTVVANQKLSFISFFNIRSSQILNSSAIHSSKSKQIALMEIPSDPNVQSSQLYIDMATRIRSNQNLSEFFRRELFYKPFLYYLNPRVRLQMTEYIRRFCTHEKDPKKDYIFKVIKSLYVSMIYLNSFLTRPLEQTFYCIKNFRFGTFFKKNKAFYIRDFLQTSNNKRTVEDQVKGQSGTLFHVISTTGKNIIYFTNKPTKIQGMKNGAETSINAVQLLFAPFTYFLVDKIVKHPLFDQVWISEISSPFTFSKDIILWVDDIPYNNIGGIKQILENKDLEILPLISTSQAERWLQEFGWLLNWKGVNFQLVSDMGRVEYKENQEEAEFIADAGFRLADKIYNTYKLTIRAYFFIGDEKKTLALLELAQFENVRQNYNKHFKVTKNWAQLQSFCCSNKW